MNNQNNQNKTILITGCSSGIGLCAAHQLHAMGYHVFATARKIDDVDRLKKQGLNALTLDLASDTSITHAVNEVLKQSNGKIYGLFNNGAFGLPGAVEDLSRDALRHQFETNLFGWHELTRQIIPIMRKQGFGRIIQNSSVLGFAVLPYRGAYCASKFALEGLTDTLRLELHGSGIHIALIEPGPIESQFRANAMREFMQYIDSKNSHHADNYQSMIDRLNKEGPAAPFTLPADAVVKKLIHALESKNPKPRYYVTFPTYLLGYCKRLLSSRLFDKLALKISGGGSR